jgi:hypothetical protein
VEGKKEMTAIDWTKFPEPWNEIGPQAALTFMRIARGEILKPLPARFDEAAHQKNKVKRSGHLAGNQRAREYPKS